MFVLHLWFIAITYLLVLPNKDYPPNDQLLRILTARPRPLPRLVPLPTLPTPLSHALPSRHPRPPPTTNPPFPSSSLTTPLRFRRYIWIRCSSSVSTRLSTRRPPCGKLGRTSWAKGKKWDEEHPEELRKGHYQFYWEERAENEEFAAERGCDLQLFHLDDARGEKESQHNSRSSETVDSWDIREMPADHQQPLLSSTCARLHL